MVFGLVQPIWNRYKRSTIFHGWPLLTEVCSVFLRFSPLCVFSIYAENKDIKKKIFRTIYPRPAFYPLFSFIRYTVPLKSQGNDDSENIFLRSPRLCRKYIFMRVWRYGKFKADCDTQNLKLFFLGQYLIPCSVFSKYCPFKILRQWWQRKYLSA